MNAIYRLLLSGAVLTACAAGFCETESKDAGDSPLDWRLTANAWCFKEYTFFEAIEKTAALGVHFSEAFQGQKISADSDAVMDYLLPDEAIERIKNKLTRSGVTLLSFYIHKIPGEEIECRKVFEFCRKLNLETIVSEPDPADLNVIEKLCDEFGINLAIHNHAEGISRYWNPREVRKVCEGRSKRIGACADTGHWLRSKLNPVEALKALEGRIISVHLKDLNTEGMEGHDVPWGAGKGRIADALRELRRQGLQQTEIGVEYEYNWKESMPEIAQCVAFYQKTVNEIAQEKPLSIGWASVDITPEKPVALVGQLNKRISQGVLDPLTATALALESQDIYGRREQAILISCDVCMIQKAIQERIRECVRTLLPDFNAEKLFLNATHTHTGPGFIDSTFKGLYDVSNDPGVMKASEYGDFFIERIANAAAQAWQNRKPGGMSWGLGHAVVGMNRRAHYFDGTSVMYGATNKENFSNLEGYEDHSVNLLFFWTLDNQLTGVAINLACTSQETEGLSVISADFWHDVREEIKKRYSKELFILPQCSAAGDLSPHLLCNAKAEDAMRERRGLSRRQEIAQRIVNAVDDVMPYAKVGIANQLVFKHKTMKINLPAMDASYAPFYETDPTDSVEVHALRLGDLAIASFPFELYLDYGVRMKARSPALLTFLIQLSSQCLGYLPTEKGVQGGGYSADKFAVGPEGGQQMVNTILQLINEMWN